MTDRRQLLLDAAVRVLGTGGPRQLTHRAVDAEAGLPEGSASNRFRTREALVAGVFERLVEVETQAWQRLAVDLAPGDVAAFAAVVGRLIREFTGQQRVVTLARHALFVEAAVRPELRPAIEAGRARLAEWGVPLLAALGATDPPAHFRALLALIDGLLGNHLVSPDDDVDPEAAVAALLHGFRAGPSA
ncbi:MULTISPECIES: TetR family transcriptional regulator C-terminal domain-containing protein [unclassified Micromonospora]|uniref:TetR/AcrR family transcriptional regulator n=1 Tax=unclassified Micromonospora TaxID=2617518 RepID=UPI001C24EAFE|nr:MULTISPECIES: TetR family transcriptional regulator C-terminal domain-containing protein [unclassified Micromonospora]MBU8860067.1 TetR family transcriptional regulator [Micromonospora sp. WMMB482]MDM4779598.1 TetR family transcriptional regulator [Micromonospora sp. b486]